MSMVKGQKNTDHALRERIRAWLAHYLEQFRVAGQTQADLAARLGIAAPSVSQYLSGKRSVGLDTLARMHTGLRVSADMILDNDPPKPQRPRVPKPPQVDAPTTTGPG